MKSLIPEKVGLKVHVGLSKVTSAARRQFDSITLTFDLLALLFAASAVLLVAPRHLKKCMRIYVSSLGVERVGRLVQFALSLTRLTESLNVWLQEMLGEALSLRSDALTTQSSLTSKTGD